MQVKTRDGFVMEAMMIKPPDFDPSKKYPVYEFTYSGPHAQSVRNSWGGAQYLFHQFLAQHGVIVWICDNRSASGKGAESAWTSYKRMGEGELRDLEDGLKWLTSQPYVDGSRVALSGWSYGGFMTSFALTHSKLWSAGLAGGTVSDWRDYDSIYTERVMLMPQNNPEGYKATAPRWAAKDLHGNILLMHGTIDDNVHMQNTIQFIYELEKANKPYQLQVYPKSRHGVVDPALNAHMRAAMWKFIQENLGVK
jgi:dipeptidyl-peptidase 4